MSDVTWPTYFPPPEAKDDFYAYWRMNLALQSDIADPLSLGYESADRILVAVGSIQFPPELDNNPAFHQLKRELTL